MLRLGLGAVVGDLELQRFFGRLQDGEVVLVKNIVDAIDVLQSGQQFLQFACHGDRVLDFWMLLLCAFDDFVRADLRMLKSDIGESCL